MQLTTASWSCAFNWASSACDNVPITGDFFWKLSESSLFSFPALYRVVAVVDARVVGELPLLVGWGTNNGPAQPFAAAAEINRYTARTPTSTIAPQSGALQCKIYPKITIKMSTTLKEFESVWPRIVADLQDHCKQYKLPQQPLDWFTKVYPNNEPLQGPTCSPHPLVAGLQHCRRKMQSWNVCHRHNFHPPEQDS